MPADRTARTERLVQHARDRHEQTLQRAHTALSTMVSAGEPITVARLARAAAVSRSWIYTQPELRDGIEQARRRPTNTSHLASLGPAKLGSTSRASEESLHRRLTLPHQRIGQLRQENQQLRDSLARAHGQLRASPQPHGEGPDGPSSWTPVHDIPPQVDEPRDTPE